jgi:hypothetical protein
MSRIMEEPKRHIHEELCSELNEMSIRLKLWDDAIFKEEDESKLSAILKARSNHPKPTNEQLVKLIEQCRNELHQYVMPYITKR